MIALRHPLASLPPERAELVLDDGIVLVSDIYRPDAKGTFPVLLMRQPYGRAIASTAVLAHPSWYAAQGYIVVIQDVRGCGDSGGDFMPFVNELRDGARTLEWAAALPGSNGKLGLYGFSYQAMTQYLAIAGKGAKRPDALAPSMGSWAPRNDWAYEGNAFRTGLNAGWATQMGKLKAAREGDQTLFDALSEAETARKQCDILLSRPDFSHLATWLSDEADYWTGVSPETLLADDPFDIPVLHTGGWADFLLQGTLAADLAFRLKNPLTSHLVVGPWAHLPWNSLSGSAVMGEGAEFSVDRAQIAFFDFYLKGEGDRPPGLRLFDMGERRWHVLGDWPMARRTEWSLSSSGLAAALLSDGMLTASPAEPGVDTFVQDPTRPAPLIGGHLGQPNGFADRSSQDCRADVAVYTSPARTVPLQLTGAVIADLAVTSSAVEFDLCATLSLVSPAGEARVLATGYARAAGAGPTRVAIALRAVCVTVLPGHAIRLSLQGAGVPAFDVHPISGHFRRVGESGQQPITISIVHGGADGSRLILTEVEDFAA